MSDLDPSSDELYAELLERADIVEELDAAQLEAWASGLFAALDDEAALRGFVAHCEEHPSSVTAAVLSGIAHLADGEGARLARTAVDRMASLVPDAARRLGQARPAQAWQVDAPFGTSIVVGFRQELDVADHAVLAEFDGERLTDLQLAGPPSELLDPDVVGDGMDIVAIEAGMALERIADGWEDAHASGLTATVGIAANQRLVRSRLRSELDRDLPIFAAEAPETDLSRGMSEAEIAEADRAALSTLRAAVGDPEPAAVGHPAWRDIVRGAIADVTPREREGLLWLEWADWLGVAIGLLRNPDGAVTPESFVDLINRCPEVSSTVHADDRDYAEWAFAIAIEHLEDHGLVADAALTDEGRATLHASVVEAWSKSPS